MPNCKAHRGNLQCRITYDDSTLSRHIYCIMCSLHIYTNYSTYDKKKRDACGGHFVDSVHYHVCTGVKTKADLYDQCWSCDKYHLTSNERDVGSACMDGETIMSITQEDVDEMQTVAVCTEWYCLRLLGEADAIAPPAEEVANPDVEQHERVDRALCAAADMLRENPQLSGALERFVELMLENPHRDLESLHI